MGHKMGKNATVELIKSSVVIIPSCNREMHTAQKVQGMLLGPDRYWAFEHEISNDGRATAVHHETNPFRPTKSQA